MTENINEAMKKILREAAEAIESASWSPPMPPSPGRSVTSYRGQSGEWTIVVCEFSIEDQGFPPGSMGYDGVARIGTAMLHLTRELAERAVERARSCQTSPGQAVQ